MVTAKIKSIHVRNIRSFEDATLALDPHLTTLVGENNVGKSTLGAILGRAIGFFSAGRAIWEAEDQPFGEATPHEIEICIDFPAGVLHRFLTEQLLGRYNLNDFSRQRLTDWIATFGSEVVATYSSISPELRYRCGQLHLVENFLSLDEWSPNRGQSWHQLLNEARRLTGPEHVRSMLGDRAWQVPNGVNFAELGDYVRNSFRRFDEFRSRVQPRQQVAALESHSGMDTANVLFNLRNHSDARQRQRYERIIEAFCFLFPNYDVLVVEREPGGGIPEIQFTLAGRSPLGLASFSAGTHQILTLLTNLIGQEGLVILVEHPESLLHPQSMRYLQRILKQSSKENQIVVTTHDVNFVEPDSPRSIQRVWVSANGVSHVSGMANTSERDASQINTALKDLRARELVFARAVILVEDESQREFILGIAPTLGFDLDAAGISVISVNGENGYKPFFTLLEGLEVPYVSLKDRHWGQASQFPRDKYFSFGAEIEDFLDARGLADKRQAAIKAVGKAKPRVMKELAAHAERKEIPKLFSDLLRAAAGLTPTFK